MQVTPRVPSHGPYAFPGFHEMRYVRLGEHSFYLSLLFRLFEEAIHPSIQTFIRRSLGSNLRGYKLIELAIDPSVSPADRLAVWNCGEGMAAVVMNWWLVTFSEQERKDFFATFQSKFKLEIVCVEPRMCIDHSRKSIFLTRSGDDVILLYNNYTLDSFLVAPDCRHIHLKYALFEQAREANPIPMNKHLFKQTYIRCNVLRCEMNLADFVFEEAKKVALECTEGNGRKLLESIGTGSPLHHSEPLYGKCRHCRIQNGFRSFNCEHLFCENCTVLVIFALLQFRCPACGQRMKADSLPTMLARAQSLPDLPVASALITCDLCCFQLEIENFSRIIETTHCCWLCNDCFDDTKFRQGVICSACKTMVVADNRGVPSISQFSSSSQVSSYPGYLNAQMKKCSICYAEKPFVSYTRTLFLEHNCFFCDQCFEDRNPSLQSTQCISCGSAYTPTESHKIEAYSRGTQIETVACLSCKEAKHLSEFSCCQNLSHWWKCRLCDICIATHFRGELTRICSICYQSFTDDDLINIKRLIKEYDTSVPPARDFKSPRPTNDVCIHCAQPRESACFSIRQRTSHPCLICDACFSQFSQNGYSATCSKCNHHVNFECSSSNMSMCGGCKTDKLQVEFSLCTQLKHPCKVCNSCVENMPNRCPLCKGEYEEQDRMTIFSNSEKGIPKKTLKALAERRQCSCGHFLDQFYLHCSQSCVCGFCIYKSYLLTGKKECPTCCCTVSGNLLTVLKCSGCFSIIEVSGLKKVKISAVCKNGYVLCTLCIQIEDNHCFCPICENEVEVESLEAIRRIQTKYVLGCYCEGGYGDRQILKCNHYVHHDCFGKIVRCRICHRQVSQISQPITNIFQLLNNS